jgi:hypothetical protein
MKKSVIIFILAAVLFLASLIRYLYKLQAPTTLNIVKKSTNIKVSKTFIDVGEKKWNVPVKVSLAFVNTGENDLFIESVEPDCHCTVASFSADAIKPKDSTIVSLQYDAKNLGPFQSSAMVTTNSPSSPSLVVFRGVIEK